MAGSPRSTRIVDPDRAGRRRADEEIGAVVAEQRVHDIGGPEPQPGHLIIDRPTLGQAVGCR